MKHLLQKAKKASFQFGTTSFEKRQQILKDLADLLKVNEQFILDENAKDLVQMEQEDPLYDRMLLTSERLKNIANACRAIAQQEDVLGKFLEKSVLKNGLKMQKVSVPLGVVACIYEARPNVTVDIAALCIFTGNVAILRGSSSAEFSNNALVFIIHQALMKNGIPQAVVSKYSVDRNELQILFEATEQVDLLIPRGSKNLIERVRKESLVPTIETGAGVCHTFVDASANIKKAVNIVVNAKTQRPSVCNALDTCIVDKDLDQSFFNQLVKALEVFHVEVFADLASFQKLAQAIEFTESDLKVQVADDSIWGKEFLGFAMSVKTVASTTEAIAHINQFGSRHSEAIVSETPENFQEFFQMVDASSVYHNASTRFTDGEVFGFGAEIGISTQKLHARGPMGASALTSYKYLLEGDGEIRM